MIPETPESVRRHINRLFSLLKLDDEMYKFEIGCSLEAAFIEGYNRAMEDKVCGKI